MRLLIELLPGQSPGNSVVLTAAVRDLKKAHPDWRINVGGGAVRDFFNFNPHIDLSVTESNADRVITAEYPFGGSLTKHYLYSYTESICSKLGIRIKRGEFRPELYLSQEELSLPRKIKDPYWILNAGYRTNISAKFWGDNQFKNLVFNLRNTVKFVQIGGGDKDTENTLVDGVVDLRKATTRRELMLLIYHSEGVVTPVSLPMHIAAAFCKPCVVIAGGREHPNWTAYDDHLFLHTIGRLKCCKKSGCFKRRVLPLYDGKTFDRSLCSDPVMYYGKILPHCMSLIKPDTVAEAVLFCQTQSRAGVLVETVAGKNYPADTEKLKAKISEVLSGGKIESSENVFIAPHHDYDRAGKAYSDVYRRLAGRKIYRVIVLGPSHFSDPGDLAILPDAASNMHTPLGCLEADTDAVRKLSLDQAFRIDNELHKKEHSVQSHYPLIQTVLPNVRVLPVLIGHPTPEAQARIAEALKKLLDDDTVLIVSSDFTHYGPSFRYTPFSDSVLTRIRSMDLESAEAIASGNVSRFESVSEGGTICGRFPVMTAMRMTDFSGAKLLSWSSSFEKDGDMQKIVSYAAIEITSHN